MSKLRSLLSLFLCALLSVSMFVPTHQAKAVDAQTAGIAKMLGGVLIIHGLFELKKDFVEYKTHSATIATNPVSPGIVAKKQIEIPLDLLEIAGGAAAMMMNADSENDLKDSAFSSPDMTPAGSPGGGSPGGSLADISNTCDMMPSLCQKDADNRPLLRLPPKEELKAAVTKGFNGQPVNADGLSLEEALNDLDDKYGQADNAIAAFNAASQSGAFDEGGANLADTSQGDGDGGIGEGLNTGRGVAGSGGGGLESITLPGGQSTDWASLLTKKKAERGPLSGAKAVGMNLEDGRTGRLLTLFERATRTLRGTRDRDILLAKVEWTRKEAARRVSKKHPNIAVSTEKN